MDPDFEKPFKTTTSRVNEPGMQATTDVTSLPLSSPFPLTDNSQIFDSQDLRLDGDHIHPDEPEPCLEPPEYSLREANGYCSRNERKASKPWPHVVIDEVREIQDVFAFFI